MTLPDDTASDVLDRRLRRINELRAMLDDPDWDADDATRARLEKLFGYIDRDDGLISDHEPLLGLLDDVLLIELAWPAFAEEAEEYRDFSAYRSDEHPAGSGGEQRAAWLRDRLAEIGLLQHQLRVNDSHYITAAIRKNCSGSVERRPRPAAPLLRESGPRGPPEHPRVRSKGRGRPFFALPRHSLAVPSPQPQDLPTAAGDAGANSNTPERAMKFRRNPAAWVLAVLLTLPVLSAGSRDVPTDGTPRIDCQQRCSSQRDTARLGPDRGGDLAWSRSPACAGERFTRWRCVEHRHRLDVWTASAATCN